MSKEYVEERNGGLYLAGTRVTLDSVVYCFNHGMSAETILAEFDTLGLAQVYGAITYYLENQAAVDDYLVRQKQRLDKMRQDADPLPQSLTQRLRVAGTQPPSRPVEN